MPDVADLTDLAKLLKNSNNNIGPVFGHREIIDPSLLVTAHMNNSAVKRIKKSSPDTECEI